MKKAYLIYIFLSAVLSANSYAADYENELPVHEPLPEPLTLEKAMDRAEAHSYQYRIAKQNVNVSMSNRNAQILSLFPNFSMQSTYTHPIHGLNSLVNSNVSDDLSLTTVGNAWTMGVTMNQQIIGLYNQIMSIGQTNAILKASAYKKSQTLQDERYLGANAYINTTKSYQLILVADNAISVAKQQLSDANARFNEGLITNADVLKLQLNLDNANTIRVRAETTYQVALETLATIIGEDSPHSIVFPAEYKSVMEEKRKKIGELNPLLATKLPQRYDVLAAERNISAQGYARYIAIGAYLPALNFFVTYAHDFKAKSLPPIDDQLRTSDNFYLGLNLTWNVIDWGIRQTQINVAGANEQIARLQYYQTQRNARVDITSAYNKLLEAYQTLTLTRNSAEYANTVYSQRQEQFQNGVITSIDLVVSSDDLISAQANYVNAIGELDLAWMAYYKSIREPVTTLN